MAFTPFTEADRPTLAAFNEKFRQVLDESGGGTAESISFDNSVSGLSAENVQDAINELTLSGGISFYVKILWENASPTSEFAPQTITLDLSEFQGAMVVGGDYAATIIDYNSGLVPIGSIGRIQSASAQNSFRGFSVESNSVTFYDAQIFNTYGTGTINNKCMIPHRIYGFKGVQTV